MDNRFIGVCENCGLHFLLDMPKEELKKLKKRERKGVCSG